MIKFHPDPGTILICEFHGMVVPEMVKRRPVITLSPRRRHGSNLVTVVPLSLTPPGTVQAYHFEIEVCPPLPAPYQSPKMWVKSDMVYTVSFSRLHVPFAGKDSSGKRVQDIRVLSIETLRQLRSSVCEAMLLV